MIFIQARKVVEKSRGKYGYELGFLNQRLYQNTCGLHVDSQHKVQDDFS